MLEAYQAFGDFEIMADLVEEMVCHLAEKFFGTLQIEHKDEKRRASSAPSIFQDLGSALPTRVLSEKSLATIGSTFHQKSAALRPSRHFSLKSTIILKITKSPSKFSRS
jgi:lysyl-tRNA synthetase class II